VATKKEIATNFFSSLCFVAVFGSGIEMGKNQDPGSGINIPDPQQCRNCSLIPYVFVSFQSLNWESSTQPEALLSQEPTFLRLESFHIAILCKKYRREGTGTWTWEFQGGTWPRNRAILAQRTAEQLARHQICKRERRPIKAFRNRVIMYCIDYRISTRTVRYRN
jgi:hypothetical protein